MLAADAGDKRKQTPLEKIKLLEEELNHLNILENPLEIENICKSIIDLKKSLQNSSRT